MIEKRPVNFITIGEFFKLPGKTIYTWYREYLSGYNESVADGTLGQYNIRGSTGTNKPVPVLKAENVGPEMALDEKMIGDEMYTVLSNRETGKIAMMAETMKVNELTALVRHFGETTDQVKNITCDLSPSYDSFCQTSFSGATRTADKFHVIKHTMESVQAIRTRLKQEELAKLPKNKSERKQTEKESLLENGESRRELLTRSRYLLFKMSAQWSSSQQRRAALLFRIYPELQTAHELSEQIRKWYDKSNIGKSSLFLEKVLYTWYDNVETANIPEMNNLAKLFVNNEQKILNYFFTGKTNALAEAVNNKIQRFIAANYGVRDKDFFLFRLAKYFS